MASTAAVYYDKIYSFKNYGEEVQRLLPIIRAHLHSPGNRLLDVACGTGRHLQLLREHFDVEGLDLDEEMLAVARQRNPAVLFHHADMVAFDLGRQFDVVTCLFSSIGYVKSLDNLARAIDCMARHLVVGGVLLVEPWFTPASWNPGTVHALLIDEPELKIARVNTSFVDGRISYFDLHHLIGTPQGTEHLVERHELGLFETAEVLVTLEQAGLRGGHDPQGLTGRGLFIASKQ